MSRFYVTTPIFYVNDAPHIGHAYVTLAADALARWHRLLGDEVFFLTGTDEHGKKVAQAAVTRQATPQQWADVMSEHFKQAWKLLDISNDDFIRTTEARHYKTVQSFLQAIYDNGYIELAPYEGRYCVSCETYYTEEELLAGNCPVHLQPVGTMKEENYFFKLSSMSERLLEWYENSPTAVLPESKRNEALSFIKGGLQDFSITRTSIDWGVPVPWDSQHVFYVWADALVNYLTAISYGTNSNDFQKWWPYVNHLIGKEIIRFHCVWWPAMCMAAGIDPPNQLFVHGWLLVGGEKMSKTKLNQISPVALVDDFGVDAVRYYLLRGVPLGADGDFSYEGMLSRYNSDLANNLGNLLSRVTRLVTDKCFGVGHSFDVGHVRLVEGVDKAVELCQSAWNEFAPHRALDAVWELIGEANAVLESEEPWKMPPGSALDKVLGDQLEVLRILALLVWPVMPKASNEIWRRIGVDGLIKDARLPKDAVWGSYDLDFKVEAAGPLFPRRKL
ncbi:MAG: methionine--tRNA ligase [Actinobacteria bacterium]|nr:methionine--tRNA ligase [Actinomycetota bacterium]MCL6104576.1 methionine--tRNA ligase [Actinomycetota bacterium]